MRICKFSVSTAERIKLRMCTRSWSLSSRCSGGRHLGQCLNSRIKEFCGCSTSFHTCKILMQKLACLLTVRASRVFSIRTPLRGLRTPAPWRDYWSKLIFGFWSSLYPIGRNFVFPLFSLSFISFSAPLSLSSFFTHFFFSFCMFQTLISTAVIDHLDFIQGDHNVR